MKKSLLLSCLLTVSLVGSLNAEALLTATEGTPAAAQVDHAAVTQVVTPAPGASAPAAETATTGASNPFKKETPKVDDKITTITLGGMERFNYNNSDKTGLYWDVLKAVFASEGITVEIKVMPYLIAISEAEKGVLDGALAYPAHQKESAAPARNVIYPYYPIDDVQLVAVYYKTTFPEFKGTPSLDGKVVALYRGYDYENLLKVKFTRNAYNELEVGLKRLEGTYADALVDIKEDISIAAEAAFIDLGKFKVVDLLKYKAYVVFANNARGKKLAEIFDRRMKQLIGTPSFELIYTGWNNAETYKVLSNLSNQTAHCEGGQATCKAPDLVMNPPPVVIDIDKNKDAKKK